MLTTILRALLALGTAFVSPGWLVLETAIASDTDAHMAASAHCQRLLGTGHSPS